MQKNIFAALKRRKKSPGDAAESENRKKKRFPALPVFTLPVRGVKLPAIFRGKKFRIIAAVLSVGVAVAVLGPFVASRLGAGAEAAEGTKTKSAQTEESGNPAKNKDQKGEAQGKAKSAKKPEDIDIGALEGHLASGFIKILRAENYMIRYKTTTVYHEKAYEVETTYAVSGSNIAMVSGDRATIVLNNKVYMLNNTEKSIISWDVTESNNLKRIDTSGMTFIGSSQTGGLTCEEYATATARIKFYFKDKALMKIATIINKQDVVMDIIEISENVPESLFTIPTGYQNTDITDVIDGERP